MFSARGTFSTSGTVSRSAIPPHRFLIGSRTCLLTLIEHRELFVPESLGRQAVLICGERILKTGEVNRQALDGLQIEYRVIDFDGRLICPGLIDPHEHLLEEAASPDLVPKRRKSFSPRS